MAVDPVCKMDVVEKSAEYKCEYNGNKYFFCAQVCKELFEEDPERFLTDEKAQ